MAAKFVVVLCALAAAGQCSVVPLARADADYTSFAYDVADPHTGDYKSQVETRVGGTVQGQYSLLDADGTRRVVDYAADDVNGFNAVVRKDPVAFAAPVVAAPAVVETRVAAPVVTAHSVAAAPIVAAKTVAAPAVYAAAPSVYAASPSVYAASPSVYATSHAAYAAPSVYANFVYAPSVYSAGVHGVVAAGPSVVAARYAAAPVVTRYAAGPYLTSQPLTYAAHSAPLSYW